MFFRSLNSIESYYKSGHPYRSRCSEHTLRRSVCGCAKSASSNTSLGPLAGVQNPHIGSTTKNKRRQAQTKQQNVEKKNKRRGHRTKTQREKETNEGERGQRQQSKQDKQRKKQI